MNNSTGFAVIGHDFEIIHRTHAKKGIYDAELSAIKVAIEMVKLRDDRDKEWLVLSDSLSSIKAIQSYDSRDPTVNFIQKATSELESRLTIMYVPAHVGIHGNEIADAKAKEASKLNEITYNTISYRTFKSLVQQNIHLKRKEIWNAVN